MLNHDGRADGPLLGAAEMAVGRYRLLFEVAPYFRALGALMPLLPAGTEALAPGRFSVMQPARPRISAVT